MIVANYGGGVNSVAMIIEWVSLNKPLDLIIFADTGAEQPHIYSYLRDFSIWLTLHGYPEITTVFKVRRDGSRETIEENCLRFSMLPSLAYGYKKCSLKFKVQPIDKFLNNHPLVRAELAAGRKITRLLGYDTTEMRRVKYEVDDKYKYEHPLIDWGWSRDDCVARIKREGLRSPGKSSCFICPSMKLPEIRDLQINYPELMERALFIEANAKQNLKSVKGLGRRFNWGEYLKQGSAFPELFPEQTICIDCGCYDG